MSHVEASMGPWQWAVTTSLSGAESDLSVEGGAEGLRWSEEVVLSLPEARRLELGIYTEAILISDAKHCPAFYQSTPEPRAPSEVYHLF